MKVRWSAIALAAGAVALLAGCGIRVSGEPSPSPRRTAATPVAAPAAPGTPMVTLPASPATTPTASPSVSTSMPPSRAVPSPLPTGAAGAGALAAAVRRLEAAAQVKAILPEFDQLAATMVARSGVPGAAVAVVAGDSTAYMRCFGLRQIGRSQTVDGDTLFQLGGLSQAYTTTMLAALAGDGEIGWDEPVRRAWPSFRLRDRWASREATFRDLTAARCGLPSYAGSELVDFGYGRAEILRRLRYLRPVAGFRAAYAPQGAVVTAAAVAAERAAGQSWARLLRMRVLDRIGDTTTTLTYREYVAAADRVALHREVAGSMVPQVAADESVLAPALGVGASVNGLVPYARLLLNGGALGGERVAPADLLAETLAPTTAIPAGEADTEAAGLGWVVSGYDGRLVASASGGLASGSSARVSLVPEDGVAVVVLANAYPEGEVLAKALTKTLLDLYVRGAPQDDWYGREWALAQAAGETAARGRVLPEQPPAAAAPPRPRRAYEGAFGNRYYGAVTVLPGPGDALRVRLGRGVTLRCVPWSGDTWRETGSGTAAVFDVRDGRARGVRLTLLAFDGRDGSFVRRH